MEISGQMEMVAESPALTAPELLHDCVSLLLWHVSVHGADGEVGLPHLLRQPVHLPLGVTEDHRLNNACQVSNKYGLATQLLSVTNDCQRKHKFLFGN